MKRSHRVLTTLSSLAFVAAFAVSAHASTLGSDNASDTAYGDGWTTGDNGGSGFAAWSIVASPGGSSNGVFVASSTANGFMPPSGGIDTGGVAWGMYANSGQATDVYRPFTGGALTLGQTFHVAIDNGTVQTGGVVGFGLQNAGGFNLWELYFSGGATLYTINDSLGAHDSTIGYTEAGLTIDFTLTETATYSATITALAGGSQTVSGSLFAQGDQGIAQFHAFNFNSGGGDGANFYVNSLAIVPEPATVSLVGLGLLSALGLRRRKA